jgi:glycosyltransferase involved in cell wall biosynthesis
MKKITVLIVNFNSSDFIELSLYALKKLTRNSYDVFILDNGSCLKDYEKLKIVCGKYKNVFIERRETDLRGSVAHGTALDILFKKVKTPFFCVLDADATWLKTAWDEILIGEINDEIKIVGTQAPSHKQQDFPLMFAILVETKTFNLLDISFSPKNINIGEDTGFEMREKYLSAGYKGLVIKMFNSKNRKNSHFSSLSVIEYYLSGINDIFASHYFRGSTLGFYKYYKINFFWRLITKVPFFGKKIIKKIGIIEKYKWINICRKIINNQKYDKR